MTPDIGFPEPATRRSVPVSAAEPLPVAHAAGTLNPGIVQPFVRPDARWYCAAADNVIANTTTVETIKAAARTGAVHPIAQGHAD